MRRTELFVSVVLVVGGLCLAALSAADEPVEKSKDRIVAVVVLKPGETKEIYLSSSCARITRGRGLLLRAMGTNQLDAKKEWSGDGISASFVEVNEVDEPATLKDAKLKLFIVRVSAAKDAKAQFKELHVADETCSGTCDADLRVVVMAP